MSRELKNIAASARARLLQLAKANKKDFNAVLLQYFQERLLYRLSISEFKDKFILKGALLFLIYNMPRSRPTKDIDFLGMKTSKDMQDLLDIMKQVVAIDVKDGVTFDPESLEAEIIKEDADYHGVRIYCEGSLERAKRRFHLDIGFGDIVVPKPVKMDFPVMLDDMPVPELIAYTPETAIAEKLEAIVKLGYATSRMKDFYDIYYMAHNYDFRSDILLEAITSTFKNRETDLDERKLIFTEQFKQDTVNNTQWDAFLNKNNLDLKISFGECVEFIEQFIDPLFSMTKDLNNWDKTKLKWD